MSGPETFESKIHLDGQEAAKRQLGILHEVSTSKSINVVDSPSLPDQLPECLPVNAVCSLIGSPFLREKSVPTDPECSRGVSVHTSITPSIRMAISKAFDISGKGSVSLCLTIASPFPLCIRIS